METDGITYPNFLILVKDLTENNTDTLDTGNTKPQIHQIRNQKGTTQNSSMFQNKRPS